MTSADRLRINRKRRENTDRKLRDLLQEEEDAKRLACVSGIAECNKLSVAIDLGVIYETIENEGTVVGVRARARKGISVRKRNMLSTKQLMTPDEFVREQARLKRMAEREIRRRRYRRKSESNLLTLGNLLAVTSKVKGKRTGSNAVAGTKPTIDIQSAIDQALRDVKKALSDVETQTIEFEKSGWVFGFDSSAI